MNTINHIVIEGDTLLNLCERYYNTAESVEMVAKYNGLNKFRDLNPGIALIFPPIVSEE